MDFVFSAFVNYWAPLAAFFAVIALVPPMKRLAPRLGLMDAPGGRKKHDGFIPLVGGVVLFPVFAVVSIFNGDTLATHWPLYAAIAVLLVTGAVDDRVHLHSWVKFGLQFVAAILVVSFGGAQIYQLGNLFGFGDVGLGWISWPFSVVSVVLLINAINLMDGLDGLAGGTVFVVLGWMLYTALSAGDVVFSPSIMVLMAALAGFLFYNMRSPIRKEAAIFMGDAGSMSLGLMIAWYAIHLSSEAVNVIEPMSVAWVLALPIWDECAQFYRRVREGRHPFSPDRGHFHHHFIRAQISVGRAVVMILMIVFLMGGFGVVGYGLGVPLPVLTVLWIFGILAHMAFSRNTQRYTDVLTRLKRSN